jgi:hypothetical protein
MNESSWLSYLTAIGSVSTPVLVLALTALGWRLRRRLERRMELEDRLREDRIDTYNDILEPFTLLLMSEAAWQSDPKNKGKDRNQIATRQMLSVEYRRKAFKMSLVGADAVVKAYNDLMQFFFRRGDGAPMATEEVAKEMMSLLGTLLLEIRRSVGNEATELDNRQMLEWFMTDARKYRGA